MDKLIAQFPKQIADAISIAQKVSLSFPTGEVFEHVVICGMGGSGIGGKMISRIYACEAKTPIVLVQDYTIPCFVNNKTLVVASSYSGTTEETLAAIKMAEERGATIVGISSGGDLMKLCEEKGYNFIRLPSGNPPRSMVAFSFIQLIHILSKAKVLEENSIETLSGCRALLNAELMTIKKEAKALASLLYQKQGVIYSDTDSEAVAIRARQQFNENSKQLVWHHVVPEMNHNELVGWAGGSNHFAVVFFESQFVLDRNKKRMAISMEIIKNKTPHILTIKGKGKSLVEEHFYFFHIIDWASVFLSEMNECDPVEVNVIDYLKGSLKKV